MCVCLRQCHSPKPMTYSCAIYADGNCTAHSGIECCWCCAVGCQREMCGMTVRYTRRCIGRMFWSRVECLLMAPFAHDVHNDTGNVFETKLHCNTSVGPDSSNVERANTFGPLAGGVIILAYMMWRFYARTIDPQDEWSTRRIRANPTPELVFFSCCRVCHQQTKKSYGRTNIRKKTNEKFTRFSLPRSLVCLFGFGEQSPRVEAMLWNACELCSTNRTLS